MSNRFNKQLVIDFGLILAVAIVILLPQILSKGLILGQDAIFHFNRFYDTAEQFKTGHFNYFLSNYGFQKAGRIVTPMYGPFFSYIFGAVLAVLGSWVKFQLVIDLFVMVAAGYGVYLLALRIGAERKISLAIGVLFLSSYSISAWILDQQFTAVGLALIPYALLFGVSFIDSKKVNVFGLAMSVAGIVQTHVLSALFVVVILTIMFCVGLVVNTDRKAMILRTLTAGMLAILLTLNVWIGFVNVYAGNNLLSTWPYTDLYVGSVNLSFGAETENDLGLILTSAVMFQIVSVFINFNKEAIHNKVLTVIGAVLLIASSKIFPWNLLEKSIPQLATTLQFPARLRGVAILLLLSGLSLTLTRIAKTGSNNSSIVKTLLLVLCVINCSVFSTSLAGEVNQWNSDYPIVKPHAIANLEGLTADDIRTAFKSKNLSEGVTMLQKTTSDYLPVDKKYSNEEYVSLHPYWQVEKHLINGSKGFNKKVDASGRLVVSWNSKGDTDVAVPVVVFSKSKLVFNGRKLSVASVKKTEIGNPVLSQKIGTNKLTVTFTPLKHTKVVILAAMLAWLLALIWVVISKLFLKRFVIS